jgi:hypothetical protein
MSGGGKGGSQTTQVKIPAWLENAAKQNIARADELSTIGYTPYYGADVAAMTPQQISAMQGTNQAAAAFGMPTADPMAGMPQAQNFGGVQAYSSGGLYDQALAELQARRPGQYDALNAPFIDPVTGAGPDAPFGPLIGGQQGGQSPGGIPSGPAGPSGMMPSSLFGRPTMGTGELGATGIGGGGGSNTIGGYTGIGDMFNGGGPGASGSTFQGGPMSGTLNSLGVSPRGSGGSSGMGGGK